MADKANDMPDDVADLINQLNHINTDESIDAEEPAADDFEPVKSESDDASQDGGSLLAHDEIPTTEQSVMHLEQVEPDMLPVPADESDKFRLDLQKVFEDFEGVSDEVLDAWREDRKQIQRALDQIDNDTTAEMPATAIRAMIESKANLLATKINSSIVAVKVLEAKSKLLASIRAPSLVQNNTMNIGSLSEILSEDIDDA